MSDVLDEFENQESKQLEFKESSGGFHATLSAFSNTEGGYILVGVRDDGTKKPGIEEMRTSEAKAEINNEKNDIEPEIDLQMEVKDDIIVVYVPEGDNPPYKAPDGTYIREDGNNKKLSREKEMMFYQETGQVRFGDRPVDNFSIEADIDKVAFQRFLSESGITDNQSIEEHLLELGLAKEKESDTIVNNAGVLMFANNPKRFVPQSEIVCGAKKEKGSAQLEDREIIDGSLIEMVEEAEEFIKRNTSTKVNIEGMQREKQTQYPIQVLREAIVNAVVHRSYHNSQESIHIDVLPGRVVISSPGGLLEGLDIDNLENQRPKRRNPKLAELMEKANYAEKMGTGIKRMKEFMQAENLPEPKFEDNGHFDVKLIGRKIPLNLEDTNLNDRQKRLIIDRDIEEPITSQKYQKEMSVNRHKAWQDLKELVKMEVLEKEGNTRGTRYHFKTDFE